MIGVIQLDKRKLNSSTILKCLAIVPFILLGVRIPYINIVALLLACCIIFCSSVTEILNILLFFLAFATIFKLGPGRISFFNFLVLAAIIKLFFSNTSIKFSHNEILSFIVFMVYTMLLDDISGLVRLISMMIYFTLMLLLFRQDEKINLRSVLLFFSLGIILASIIALFKQYIPGLSLRLRQSNLRLEGREYIGRFSGLQGNPNFYTMDITIALAGWFGLIICKRAKLIDYVFVVILSIFGVMSISKSFLAAYIVLLFITLVSFTTQKNMGIIKGISIVLILIIVIYVITDKGYIKAYMYRLMQDDIAEESLSGVTTGRYDLWVYYITYIFNDIKVLFLGEGIGAANYLGRASHNYFIEIVYYFGIIGGILYFLCIKNVFPKRDLSIKRSFVNYIPIILLFVRGMAINLIMRESIFFYYIIIAVMLNTDFDNQIENIAH